jgi:hypothetical protein
MPSMTEMLAMGWCDGEEDICAERGVDGCRKKWRPVSGEVSGAGQALIVAMELVEVGKWAEWRGSRGVQRRWQRLALIFCVRNIRNECRLSGYRSTRSRVTVPGRPGER